MTPDLSTFDVRRESLVSRLRDRRSGTLVLVSHCLLNENTRYLGGACRAACVREVVEQCLERDIAIVQMPCPEQAAWGGVLKRRMLRLYGLRRAHPALHWLARLLLPIALLWTRLVYRGIARRVAAQVDDYVSSGFRVLGVVGVDGSPSCGVQRTIDIARSVDEIADLDPGTMTVDRQNAMVRRNVRPGRGLFSATLEAQLRRRGLAVHFMAHDLIAELDGSACSLTLAGAQPAGRARSGPSGTTR